jgi:hypothetical protein
MGSVDIELLLISEAVSRLESGMFGGVKHPELVLKVKEQEPALDVGSGPRREDASRAIYKAIMDEKLAVYVLQHSSEKQSESAPLEVPKALLQQMIRARGGLPDYAIRPETLSYQRTTGRLESALRQSALYLQVEQFDAWYKKNRKKRVWRSQRSSNKPRIGRPKEDARAINLVIDLVNSRVWSAQNNSVAELVRLLVEKGEKLSRQTVKRVLEHLYKETGECEYRKTPESSADNSEWGSFDDLMNRRRREFNQRMTKSRG